MGQHTFVDLYNSAVWVHIYIYTCIFMYKHTCVCEYTNTSAFTHAQRYMYTLQRAKRKILIFLEPKTRRCNSSAKLNQQSSVTRSSRQSNNLRRTNSHRRSNSHRTLPVTASVLAAHHLVPPGRLVSDLESNQVTFNCMHSN